MASEFEIPAWFSTLTIAAISAASGFSVALINRGPAMQAAATEAARVVMSAQTSHIATLSAEVHSLRDKVDALTRALQAKDEHCNACEHWQDMIQPELEKLGGGCRNLPPDAI